MEINQVSEIKMSIPFSPPYIDQSVFDEVIDTLKSGWITTGPKVKALEEEIKKYAFGEEVLCVNSWTSGAIMVLRWLGIGRDDEVIIPAYTYSATALAVIHAGGKPVIVDVSKDDFNITAENIRRAINPRTKAIIPVDFAGWPCNYDEIMRMIEMDDVASVFSPSSEVQQKLGRILVIADAAHSLGAIYEKNQRSADVTIYSLHAVKNITTAEGGAICLNLPSPFSNSELYQDMRRMTLNCQTKDALTKSKAGGWQYDIVGLGMKINMPDINAAIGLAQIRGYASLLDKRRQIYRTYADAFSQYDWAVVPVGKDSNRESSYHLFPLRVKGISEAERNTLISLLSGKGVAANVHFIPLPMLSYFKQLGYSTQGCPNSLALYESEISLPIYPQLADAQLSYVIESVVDAYSSLRKNFQYVPLA